MDLLALFAAEQVRKKLKPAPPLGGSPTRSFSPLIDLDNSTNMQAVTMYTTAVCPYCIRAKQVLKARGVETINEIRIDARPEEREAMMKHTGRRTVPQIYIGDTHVGGCDELMALDAKGALAGMLKGKVSQS